MGRALTVKEVLNKKRQTFPFEREWADAFAQPERTGVWFIWGRSCNGKTSFATRPDDENVEKSYLMYDFVRLPVMLEWQKRLGLNAFVAVGPSLELRWHERSRYVVGKDKQTQATDINMNPVGLGLDLRAGYGMVMLYARTSLTPLLKSALAPKCYPVSIGLGLRF